MNRSTTPFPSPATRFEANEENRTWRPSRLASMSELMPLAWVPSVATLRRAGGTGCAAAIDGETTIAAMAAHTKRTMQETPGIGEGGHRPAYCIDPGAFGPQRAGGPGAA